MEHVALVVNKIVRLPTFTYGALPYFANTFTGPLSADPRDWLTQVLGLAKRLLRTTPPVDQAVVNRFRIHVRRWLRRNLVPLNKILSFDEWLESTEYTMSRKDQLRKLWFDMHESRPTKRDASKVKSFIKSEFYEEFKSARWINSRSDKFKVYSGRFFKSIEEEVYKYPAFIKHVPVPERPQLVEMMKSAGKNYVSTDFTSFEALFTPKLMDACECELYKYMLSHTDPNAAKFICSTITGMNRLSTRSGVKLNIRGRRMSGDMCTSLGNGFSNLMIWDFLFSEKNHIHETQYGKDYSGFVEGDDGLFAFNGIRPTSDEYAKLGFIIKIEDVIDPCLASFCGIMSVDGKNFRNPRSFIQGFGWTDRYSSAGFATKMGLLLTKALSCIYECPSCPVLRAIADRALFLSERYKAVKVEGYRKVPLDFVRCKFDPTPNMRLEFAKMFGISIETQLYLEALISSGGDDDLSITAQTIGTHFHVSKYMSFYLSYG